MRGRHCTTDPGIRLPMKRGTDSLDGPGRTPGRLDELSIALFYLFISFYLEVIFLFLKQLQGRHLVGHTTATPAALAASP